MSLNKQALRFHHLTKPERPFIITDMRTAFTCRVRSFPVASLELEENAAAFLGGGYFLRFKIPKTTVASSIRSVSTSIVVMRVAPLFRGNNLAVPYQQLHYSIHGFILSINRSSGRFLCICLVFSSYYTQNRHTSRCACFPYITLYPVTRCLLPQNQQIGYCTCRDDDDPAGKRPTRSNHRQNSGRNSPSGNR